MSKQGGLGANFYAGGVDVSGDIGQVNNLSTPLAVGVVTGIDKFAFERLALKKDGALAGQTWWNTARVHTVLSLLPTADVMFAYYQGTAIGNDSFNMVAKQLNYDPARAADGMLTTSFSAQANGYGAEWGVQLTAGMRTDVAATNGASLDNTAGTAFGLQAYLHVFSVVGTSVTVTLQGSPDNNTFSAIASPMAFSPVLGGATGQQRIAVANTTVIPRYVRAITTGTFSSAVFAVVLVKNAEAGVVF